MDPTSVAGYRVVERIGRGGMGVVYRARDSVLDRDVALKYVDSAGAPEGRVERLIREAKIASSLQHPGIVTIYGFVSEGPCIAMEYIRGDTLSAHLLPDGMALDKAVRLGLQIAEALHYAHQSGVIHADLKPSNIMIDLTGRAKVLDFGLAHWRLFEELQTVSDSGEHLQQLAGTIPYMSPELVMGRPIDYRSDIFSFGCVLFEMLTGQRPFSADNPAATLNSLLNRMPKGIEILRRKVPAVLAELVLRMLEKDPDCRLSTLGDVIVVFQGFCDEAGAGVPRRRIRHKIFFVSVIRRCLPVIFTVFLALLMYLVSEPSISERQLRVFLAQPEYYRKEEGTPMDAVIWSSVVNGLHLLRSIQPVLYHQPPIEDSNPAQLAKLAGADEWIHIRFQPESPLGNVQLQRVRTSDGSLINQINFSVIGAHIERSAQAVLSQTLTLYDNSGNDQYDGYSSFSPEAYRRFAEIYSVLYQGGGNKKLIFQEINGLIHESNIFPAAEVLAVDLAHDLFSDTGNLYYLDEASKILGRLKFYHPNPIVVLKREINIAIDRDDIKLAKSLIDHLDNMSPGDPSALLAKSRLAEEEGDLDVALQLISKASSMAPLSWGIRYRAAALAIHKGDAKLARAHIAEILKLTPRNTLVLGQLGLVELLYGDVDSAVDIYNQLLKRKQHRSYLINLGLAMMLKDNYRDARDKFSLALELQPNHYVAMLNLADAEMALGNRDKALDIYQNILEVRSNSSNYNIYDKMVEAQCLAHLGRYGLAIELTLDVLAKSFKDPEVAYQAALVYSLAGEHESALVNARIALRGGMDIRWFKLPVFPSYIFSNLSDEGD